MPLFDEAEIGELVGMDLINQHYYNQFGGQLDVLHFLHERELSQNLLVQIVPDKEFICGACPGHEREYVGVSEHFD